MLCKNIPLFHEVNALPILLDIQRLNDGEGIESTMKRKNAKYHNLCRIKFNDTKLEQAQKRHMSPMPSGSRVNLYTTKKAKKRQTEAESSCTQEENMMKEIALAELVKYIFETQRNSEELFRLADLATQLGFSSAQVHSTRLKDKLLQKMPELEAHTKGRDVLLMFEKDIGPAVAFACDYNDTMHMAKTAEMIRCQLATKKTTFSGSLVSEDIDDSIPPYFVTVGENDRAWTCY
ncbi:unnamed protein product [Mytilus coruscus]|uniref:Uncharacterized protein n=1 Tax=Mytilus coruscus TaxID=42192 RepID=A0A6J8AF92_MYTCO|nr:unnamed protein product [Mytilus coruscus]